MRPDAASEGIAASLWSNTNALHNERFGGNGSGQTCKRRSCVACTQGFKRLSFHQLFGAHWMMMMMMMMMIYDDTTNCINRTMRARTYRRQEHIVELVQFRAHEAIGLG